MLRLIVVLFIFALSLDALSDSQIVKRANDFMKSSNKSNHFRAYNDYKNLYLRSIMSEDNSLRIISLKGIVNSGKKLHIDTSSYKNELNDLKLHDPQATKKIKQTKTHIKQKTITVNSSHKLQSINFQGDELILSFDKKLKSKQVNYFTLYDPKKQQYKYVFDIHASMLIQSKTLRKEGIKRIKLAQYKPNTIRLVIQNNSKLKINFKKKAELLIVKIKHSLKTKKTKVRIPLRLDRNKIIVIDAGHGGKDPGAIGYKKYQEKVVVFQVARELRQILKSRGYKVYMTRNRDKYVKLSERTKYANKKNADIFVSVHANAVAKKNAHKVQGIECYFLSKSKSSKAKKVAAKENSSDLSDMNFYGKQSFLNTLNSHNIVASNKLAIDLQRGMLGSLKKSYKNVHDGGVREGPFWVLVGAQMPSVLVEIGFMTHPSEAKRLVSSKYQKKIAHGLGNGIERYFLNSK